jgi:hypothetical protein
MRALDLDSHLFPLSQPASPSTGSEMSLATVTNWVKGCTAGHQKCKIVEDTSRSGLPTRLVEIDRDSTRFRILNSHALPQSTRYAIISHHWGASTPYLLTTENEKSLRQGLPISVLPKTITDAIKVVLHLNIRYLWVDSLCIIQDGDNGEDWQRESQAMTIAFRNAFVCIAAHNSTETSGMFFDREPAFYDQHKLNINILGLETMPCWILIDEYMWEENVEMSRLSRRGWVLQQRLLAARTIHFCDREIFWECQEKSSCESFPSQLPPPDFFKLGLAYSLSKSGLWEKAILIGGEEKWCSPIDHAYEVWDDIVKYYSGCQLTHSTDKLVAIAGVARHMKAIIQDQYVVGMWCKQLSAELGWWLNPEREKHVYGDEPPFYAPSFSWTSVKGQISSSGPFSKGILVKVACVPIENQANSESFTGDDVFGPLQFATFQLKVTGLLRQMKLRQLNGVWYMVPLGDAYDESAKHIELRHCIYPVLLDFHIPESNTVEFETETFYYMPWRYGPSSSDDADMAKSKIYSMLFKSLDLDRNKFRRIGYHVSRTEDEMAMHLNCKIEELKPGTCWPNKPGMERTIIVH